MPNMPLQIATNAMFGVGLQKQYDVLQGRNANFNWFSTTAIPFGPNKPIQTLPPEMGRFITPRGAFPTGIWGAGSIPFIPRASGDFGNILLAAIGQDVVTPNFRFGADEYDAAQNGAYIHTFTFNTQEADIPYVSLRRWLPHLDVTKSKGEQAQDGRIGNMELNLPATGTLSATTDFVARIPRTLQMFKPTAYADWLLGSVQYDEDDAFLLGVHSDSRVRIEIDGQLVELPITGCVLTLTNNLLTPDQGRIVGDPTPYDFPVLARQCAVRVTVLVQDYDLYSYLYSNLPHLTARTFSPTVFKSDVDIRAYSPLTFEADTADIEYAIQFRTLDQNIAWMMQAPIQPAASQPLALTLLGTLQRQDYGPYFQLRLLNDHVDAYAVPTTSGYGFAVPWATPGCKLFDEAYDGDKITIFPREYSAGSVVSVLGEGTAVHTNDMLATVLAGIGEVPNGMGYEYKVYNRLLTVTEVPVGTPFLDDMSIGASTAYTDTETAFYDVIITTVAASDKFKWRKNNGAWSAEVTIPGAATEIELSDGVYVEWAAVTPHAVGDQWLVSVQPVAVALPSADTSNGPVNITDNTLNGHILLENIPVPPDGVYDKVLKRIANLDAVFTGTGLDNCVPGGAYTGLSDGVFYIEIDSVGTPDTFRWRKNDGAWTTGVAMTGAAQVLSDAVTVAFAVTTGHDIGDLWTLPCNQMSIIATLEPEVERYIDNIKFGGLVQAVPGASGNFDFFILPYEVIVAGGTLPAGALTFVVLFRNAAGDLSNAVASTGSFTPGLNTAVKLTNLPVGCEVAGFGPDDVASRLVYYYVTAAPTVVYLGATIDDNTTTEVTVTAGVATAPRVAQPTVLLSDTLYFKMDDDKSITIDLV